MHPLRFSLAIGLLAMHALPSPAADGRTADALAATVVERVAGTAVECPASLLGGLHGDASACYTTSLTLKKLQKELRGPLRGGDVVPLAELDWIDPVGTFVEKRVFAGRELFVLRFDEASGTLAVVPSHSCFDTDALDAASSSADDEVTPPALVERAEPEYPEAARKARRPGFAMLQVVVLEDGTVGAVCPLYVAPPGLGFRAAGRKAVAANRYRPATRDGAAVPYVLNASVTWEP